jgi:hypothetical protein
MAEYEGETRLASVCEKDGRKAGANAGSLIMAQRKKGTW